ncbi:MAG: FAD-dependent oxidoreductase, partial [Candidatus Bathyarchaeia archaeon]
MEKKIDADVLVIGGGMAGCFAAIKAREKAKNTKRNLNVVLVNKGYVGRSGQTHRAACISVF